MGKGLLLRETGRKEKKGTEVGEGDSSPKVNSSRIKTDLC